MNYLEAFGNLRPNTKYARKSPLKAVLLLAIIELYEKNILLDNEIKYNDELKAAYLEVWNKIMPTGSLMSEAFLPYWYMQNEDFWHVVPVLGEEDILLLLQDDYIKPSESKICECVQYVELDEDLFFMFTMSSGRRDLKRVLLETYFELSDAMIDKLSEVSTNTVDRSALAMSEYKKLIISSDAGSKGQPSSSNQGYLAFPELDEEVQLTFSIEYYKFQKTHRYEREMFKELFPRVDDLYNRIVVSPIRNGEILPSFSFVYENFLGELKIALMSDDGALDIIDSIDDAIVSLNGVQQSVAPIELPENVTLEDNAISTNAELDLDVLEVKDREQLLPALEDRNGIPWTVDEQNKLSTCYQLGYAVEDIAAALGRTESSVEKMLSKLIAMDFNIEEERVSEEFVASDEASTPVDFFVENLPDHGGIYNMQGKPIYTINGQLKVFNGKIYRFNFKDVCLTVKDLERCEDGWRKGVKKIVAYPESALYQILKPAEFIYQIEDLAEYPHWENNRILVDGNWYDFEGNYIGRSEELNPESNVFLSSGFRVLKDRLEVIDGKAQISYDYLWLLSILDFITDQQYNHLVSYDNIACMMIANAWEILNVHPELRTIEENLADCIEFLIEESKEYMDEALDWSSPKQVVYNAIEDYPMAGIFEDTVEDLVETSPYNMLKLWISAETKEDMVVLSNAFHNDCMYALHPKRVDPTIEINSKWTHSVYNECSDLKEALKQHYIEYVLNS